MFGTAMLRAISQPKVIRRAGVIPRPRWGRAAFWLSWAAIFISCLLVWAAMIKLIF